MRGLLLGICLPGLALASPESVEQIRADHGLSLAISGMIIVFIGLALISGFIALLPKLLGRFEKREAPKVVPAAPRAAPAGGGLEPELLAAVAMVLRAESERASGLNLKVTMPLTTSPWALSGQMRVLPGRIK